VAARTGFRGRHAQTASTPFLAFATTAEAVASSAGTRRKVKHVADYLASLPPTDLPIAATFMSGAPFSGGDPRVLQVGWALLRDAAARLLPFDEELVRTCSRVVGDPGETLGKLMRARNLLAATDPTARKERPQQRSLLDFGGDTVASESEAATLQEVRERFETLAATRGPEAKRDQVEAALRRLADSPLEVTYFVKIMLGDLRIGLLESLVEEALARAFGRNVEAVRMANMLSGDIAHTATLAREDRLEEATFRLGHPLKFMLASPLEETSMPADLDTYLVEDKFDGIRCQLHKEERAVKLFTRNHGDVTLMFPDVVEAAQRIPGSFVLDGEIIAVDPSGRAANFARLQRRLGRKAAPEALQREVPVKFVAYDLLFHEGRLLYGSPLTERLATLEAMALAPHLMRSPVTTVATAEDVHAAFDAALSRGNEGIMLKRCDSTYEFGRRGRAWLKLKRPFATLDVVITAAEIGHGKRAGLLSDYTFAVLGPQGRFLNVGKAYSGLTDVEIGWMTRRLKALTRDRRGSVHLVRPEIVLEVAFDGIQESPRHTSGYALRFPRIVRIREDKGPQDVDTLETVRALFEKAIGKEEGVPATGPAES